MSKFDEILNSSDASDALLGEQIDKKADKSNFEIITQTMGSLTIQRSGNVVTINGYVQNIAISDSSAVIGNINESIGRPSYSVRCACNVGANAYSVGQHGLLIISTDGTISVKTSYTGTATVCVSCSYIIDKL